MYNYNKLKGKIVEKYGTMGAFAKALGCSDRILSLRMNNKVDWRQGDIIKTMNLLGLPIEVVHIYFFTKNVQVD